MKKLYQEFKPALFFLTKFVIIYLAGNIVYGLFVESHGNTADPLTVATSQQTSFVLNTFGENTTITRDTARPVVALKQDDFTILDVYEGCNGVNVVIVFSAFLFAFGGAARTFLWFFPFGITAIHVINLARISLLYFTALYRPADFYYFHKYFFTAILYVAVFGLWALWVLRFQGKTGGKQTHGEPAA